MVGAVIQLFGFPGTGKLTIAREIQRQLEAAGRSAALLDNHSTTNLVWTMVPPERKFDPDVMAHIFTVRAAVLAAARELIDAERVVLFTNFLPAGRDPHVADGQRELAIEWGKPFLPIVLTCDRAEVLARVGNEDRARNLKLADPDVARLVMDAGQTLPTHWPELVELDITGLAVEESAARIIAMADAAG